MQEFSAIPALNSANSRERGLLPFGITSICSLPTVYVVTPGSKRVLRSILFHLFIIVLVDLAVVAFVAILMGLVNALSIQ